MTADRGARLDQSRTALLAALGNLPLTRVASHAPTQTIAALLAAQIIHDRAVMAAIYGNDPAGLTEPYSEPTHAVVAALGAARALLRAAVATLPDPTDPHIDAALAATLAHEAELRRVLTALPAAGRSTWINTPVFAGELTWLEFLDPHRHRAGLIAAGADPAIWTYIRFARADTPAGMDAHIAEVMRRWDAGLEVPYVIRRRSDDTIVGLTRFLELHEHDHNVELGTWLNPSAHGQGINPEVKLLMIDHAFGALGCRRLQIKTNAHNTAARRSLDALGAVYEGTIRQHIVTPTGEFRDSAYYSILADEWPSIRSALVARIQRKGGAQ